LPVVVALGDHQLEVEPGRSVSAELSVANTGTIVEQFALEALGPARGWMSLEPPSLSLFPGTQGSVRVTIAPPRTPDTPSDALPFAVKVTPANDPDGSVVEEGTVRIGEFRAIAGELLPAVVHGRLHARQRVAIDNRSNVEVPVVVTASDPAQALKIRVRPKRVISTPNRAHLAKLRIKPRKRMWKGAPRPKPYRVTLTPENHQPITLDTTFTQHPVLPKLVWALLALALLAALWFLLFKPAIDSTATAAASHKLAAAQAANAALANQVAANSHNVATLAKKVSTTTTTTVKVVPTTTTTTLVSHPVVLPLTQPDAGRLSVALAAGTSGHQAFTVPTGDSLAVTGLVLENDSGGSGLATIERVLAPGAAPEKLLVQNLATMSAQEFTFPTPIVFPGGTSLVLETSCASTSKTPCDVGAFYTGTLTAPAKIGGTTTTGTAASSTAAVRAGSS